MSAVKDATLQPKGFQQFTQTGATAAALTVPAGATRALIKVETVSARWRDDAVDPTAAVGMLTDVGDEFWYTGQLKAFRIIATSATVTVDVSYYA